MEQSRGPPIGIDFGTAYIRVAVSDGTKCTMIPDQHGNSAMPSYVAFTNSGMLIGEEARAQAQHNPANTIFHVIRLIGRRYSHRSVRNDMRLWPFKVISGPDERLQVEVYWNGRLRQFNTVEICSMLLKQIKENAEKNLRTTVTDAVITVPVRFNFEHRLTIKQAGMIAGLNFKQIISAPSASAFYYGTERSFKGTNIVSNVARSLFQREPEEHNMFIFDLGAGTLDVAVVSIIEDKCKVMRTEGNIHLGGVDFDNNLAGYFLSELKKRGKEDISNIPMAISNLRTLCEKAKISLSSGNDTVPMKMTPLCNDLNFEVSFTQEKFNELNNDLYLKCMNIVKTCLNGYKVQEVILAGSSARISLLKNYIQDFFGSKVLNISPHLEAATAYGAAFQAFFLSMRENGSSYCLSLFDAKPEEYVIGIDFGTTYSSVAISRQGVVEIIENEYGSDLTPSVVAFNDTGHLVGGIVNKEQVTTNHSDTIPNIKRLIGRRYSDQAVQNDSEFLLCSDKNRFVISVQYRNEEKHFAPEEIAAMILSKMIEIAEAHLYSMVTEAVISVPTFFSDSQRKAIKDAGVIAGLSVVHLLNDSIAAAISYMNFGPIETWGKWVKVLIFNLGGGNLDVSVIAFKLPKIIEVLAVAGDTNLGGEDFDNNMVSHFVEKFKKEKRRDIRNEPKSLKKLRAACEKAKRVLSTNDQTVVKIDALVDGINFVSSMTREKFEEINASLFKRCINCVEKCLEAAKLDKSHIDEVVLIGGSTKIPKIQQVLHEFFNGKEICKWMNVVGAIVYGAATHAKILCGYEDELFEFKRADFTSLSLGIIGNEDGALNLLFPKLTRIPATKKLIFTNWVDGLSSFSIQVQELELKSTIVFTLSGIPPKQRGNSEIIASFEVDSSGILNLRAKDVSGREEIEIEINKDNGGLTLEEIQKMVKAAVRYKANDEEDRKRAAAVNALNDFAYEMKAIAREGGLSTASKRTVEKAVDEAMAWLETNCYATVDEITAQKKQLETIKGRIVYLGTTTS